ncbi:disease resistance-like protein DSC1 [Mangifera indica]|uniref:disease resistance-like protein DSC1 n=1 Tax=Mangifera indica TaxID=29780 RepID=UPI001CFBC63C|nr:disease resistance-like protein DSC1 [Mangifera indica]
MSKIGEIHLSSETFKNMHNLRLLKFYGSYHPFGYFANKPKLYFNQGLEYLSDELRYLFWAGYPLKTLPLRFSPEKLFEISLPFSNIEKLWTGTKPAFKLKSIELYYSQHLIEIPDVSEAPNIEIINLAGCTNLVEVPSSIQYLNDLRILKLNGCKSLRNFPSNIHFKSLVTLDLASCINITEFPQISGNLRDLELGGTSIEEVPSSIACLTELCLLSLTRCSKLKSISTSICKLKSLQKLSLSMCAKLESFPEILEKMECLEFLWLNGATEIKELPSSIENLNGLQVLELADCKNLETIPSSIKKLTSLAILDLSGCTKLGKLPELSALCSLKDLDLSFCNLTKIPEEICCISSLDTLTLDGNNFESLPSRIKQLSRLTFLSLNNCSMLKSVPELPSCLRELNALHCKWL